MASISGVSCGTRPPKPCTDVSLYAVANYLDMFLDQDCNDEAYAFWRKKVCERVKDPVKRELLAPEVQAYPIGCKNPSLEENFYEVCDRDNIEIIDVKATPVVEVTPTGIKTSTKEIDLDILVFATGASGFPMHNKI